MNKILNVEHLIRVCLSNEGVINNRVTKLSERIRLRFWWIINLSTNRMTAFILIASNNNKIAYSEFLGSRKIFWTRRKNIIPRKSFLCRNWMDLEWELFSVFQSGNYRTLFAKWYFLDLNIGYRRVNIALWLANQSDVVIHEKVKFWP